ncbi:hypothetical protein [Enterococcus diestrammenae]|uniref:hypothetical protein n=1 Tax=Enterococcus diestrammenae TaxID=1155073 RepID=UPI001956A8DD
MIFSPNSNYYQLTGQTLIATTSAFPVPEIPKEKERQSRVKDSKVEPERKTVSPSLRFKKLSGESGKKMAVSLTGRLALGCGNKSF